MRRLLVLSPFPPRGDARHGGGRAVAELLAVLVERYRIAIVYLRGADDPPMDAALAARCSLVREVPHTHPLGLRHVGRRLAVGVRVLTGRPWWVGWWRVPAYAQQVRDVVTSWDPDLIQIEFPLMAQYLSALPGCRAPRVLIEHDPSIGLAPAGDRIRNSTPGIGARLLRALDARAWRRYQSRILAEVQRVVVFTERDRTTLQPFARKTPIAIIPLGVRLPAVASSACGTEPATLLFVGSFRHLPNLDAAERLVRDIFPAVLAAHPLARLVLVGEGLPDDFRRSAGSRVECAGGVVDLSPHLERAAVVTAPLRLGGGMRVKMLEAMAAGKAVVATRLAVEGLAVTDDRQVALAESDQEFTRRIVSLLGDAEHRARLGRSARAWAAEHLPWSKVADAYERLYSGLIDGAGGSA